MVSSEKKTNIILWSAALVLAFLFLLSFSRSAGGDSRKPVKTALLNPKNLERISYIEISEGENAIVLEKDSFWKVKNKDSRYSLPADNERINRLIKELAEMRTLYKVSDIIKDRNDFGLTDGSEIHLKYKIDDSETDLIFGKTDFSKTSRYFMSGRNASVYEIDTLLDKYLSASVKNWSEAYLISRQILGNVKLEDIQSLTIWSEGHSFKATAGEESFSVGAGKILELRHGGVGSVDGRGIFAGEVELELGNKSKIILRVYNSDAENEYTVKNEYIDAAGKTIYESFARISSWTFNRLVMSEDYRESEL